ncbi:glycoside hydrolase family 6 protein [Sorangium atrum]|uniref:Glucanase n=1 Tax=Sorangium atrum TaxID=2995308 RepID=A0ABT5CFH3_9BACT|nr:glycoside hydrolase family 6 protein [Sorangium aterium]MDC0683841.1 glycoside hydrolase family 6 protein [Sorangium aterium]
MATSVAVILALTACGGDGGSGDTNGTGGGGNTSGVGAGTPTSSGVGAGTPTSTGNVDPTTTSTGNVDPTTTSTGNVDPTTTSTGNVDPTTSAASGGGNCSPAVDITAPSGNPFADATLFVDPGYVTKVDSSIAMVTDTALKAKMEKVKEIQTAFWLDTISAVSKLPAYLDAALKLQNELCKPVTALIVVYDLPNRDCHAKASNGELHLNENGAQRYKEEYIAPIKQILAAHSGQRIAAVIEPDSLPNIATNLGTENCDEATAQGYRDNVAHALKELNMPHVYQYIDAAHSGWLGWPDNQKKGAKIFAEVIKAAGSPANVRGFATNVANYTQLSYTTEKYEQQSNPCYGELDYVDAMASALSAEGLGDKHFIIDTSRNGVGNIRDDWGYWCNNKGAGMGQRPKANPGGATNLDAYVWVKPPGDSDGVGQSGQPRYDSFCGMPNADTRAPQAGQWFHDYFVECVKNANPPL